MIQALHEFDLTADGLFALNLLHLFFHVDLECDFLVRFLMHTYIDNCIGTLTDLLPDNIIIERSFGREDYNFLLLLLLSLGCNKLLLVRVIAVLTLQSRGWISRRCLFRSSQHISDSFMSCGF
jgi:hypothetical protein